MRMENLNIAERFYSAIERDRRERKAGIHVSDLIGPCLRQSYYRLNFGESYNRTTALNFWGGRKLHETPILREHELELEAYGVHATIDEYEDGVLVDKKNLFRDMPLPPQPSPQYIAQMEYYTVILAANDRPVMKAVLLYIPWFNLQVGPMEVEVTDQLRPVEVVRAELVSRAAALTDLPSRRIGDHCVYCQYFNRCFCVKMQQS
jgi:CRISPR/Cas system-associated exonuclease Cas4 (RecB family)